MSTPTTKKLSMESSTVAAAATVSSQNSYDDSSTSMIHDKIISLFSKIDPFLRFLTKATGKTSVPLKLLHQVLPKSNNEVSSTVVSSDGSCGVDSNAPHNKGSKQTNNFGTENDVKCNDSCNMNEVILLELNHRGVLNYDAKKQTVGFPLPPSPSNSNDSSSADAPPADPSTMILPKPPSKMVGKGLHGSSEPAAKRRMKVLKWSLERVPSWICKKHDTVATETKPKAKRSNNKEDETQNDSKMAASATTNKRMVEEEDEERSHQEDNVIEVDDRLDECKERSEAYQALDSLLSGVSSSFSSEKKGTLTVDKSIERQKQSAKQWLPCQAAYAGSHPSRDVRYGTLSKETLTKIPRDVLQLFEIDSVGSRVSSNTTQNSMPNRRRQLFLHQVKAIESAMDNIHTVVQTATGSGKSICFLLPVIARTMSSLGSAAILLFPTKALAQDQYSKIKALLLSLPIKAGVIDGDTPHQQRDEIASNCQIILTNPDTLHAAILPNWKKKLAYHKLLSRITTIVVDEAHVYVSRDLFVVVIVFVNCK